MNSLSLLRESSASSELSRHVRGVAHGYRRIVDAALLGPVEDRQLFHHSLVIRLLAAYRPLYRLFGLPESYPVLRDYFHEWIGFEMDVPTTWTFVEIQPKPGWFTVPWHVAVVGDPPWPALPAHCMPLSTLEVNYLSVAWEAAKPELVQARIAWWARDTQPLARLTPEVMTWIHTLAQIDDGRSPPAWPRAAADSFWSGALARSVFPGGRQTGMSILAGPKSVPAATGNPPGRPIGKSGGRLKRSSGSAGSATSRTRQK